jgi:hypothetical protein
MQEGDLKPHQNTYYSPTGTVTFKLYATTDSNCTGDPIFTSADKPLSGGTATSDEYTTDKVGTYHWIATYNGDGNNNSVSSACADEAVTTVKALQT